MLVAWRLRDMFEKILEFLMGREISAVLESKAAAEAVCAAHGTNVEGL